MAAVNTVLGPGCRRPLTWGSHTLGGAFPLVATATAGRTFPSILTQVQRAWSQGAEVIEVRLDHLSAGNTSLAQRWAHVAAASRAFVHDPTPDSGRTIPGLLLTCRTSAEGGQGESDPRAYRALLLETLEALAERGALPDAVDVEEKRGCLRELVAAGTQYGVDVVASAHEWSGTPSVEELVERGQAMAASGAHAVKIATMAHSPADTLTLLQATSELRATLDIPLITMAMGRVGAATRLVGGQWGSALTFAAVRDEHGEQHASAPGQMDMSLVRAVRAELWAGSH